MTRQRCVKALVLALVAGAGGIAPAGAVTLSIDSTYVMVRNCTSAGSTGSVGVRFRCPPLGTSAVPGFTTCNDTDPNLLLSPLCGNISNDPHVEFETGLYSGASDPANGIGSIGCFFSVGGIFTGRAPQQGTIGHNVCNDSVFLCGAVKYTNETNNVLALDEISVEVFKFQDGSNQNDAGSTPPIRSYFIDNAGSLTNNTTSILPPACVLFDGAVNIQGELGKTNGTYGFRMRAKTQIQSSTSGNITITAERSYPSGNTLDVDGNVVPQRPLTIDVTNIHVMQASTTVVGRFTGVSAQPYNITYRLSKDATMFINILDSTNLTAPVRRLVPGRPRSGEGTPKGTLLNGDSWNGRADNADLVPPGLYLATLQAYTQDQYGRDLSWQTTRQIGLDPLHVTDIRVLPLLGGSTSLAVLTYVLTEPATTFIDIYPPNIQFCNNALNRVNDTALDQAANLNLPPKDFSPRLDNCAGAAVTPLRRIIEQKNSRTDVVSFWDGKNDLGEFMPDGDYVFVIYAALASQNGFAFGGSAADKRIWTSIAKTGFLPILRGHVGVTQITPSSSVVGSSPPVAGINPFFFRYTLSREGTVNVRVFDASGKNLVRTLVKNELRPGLFGNQETWSDGVGDNGLLVSSGAYLIELTAADPVFPAKVSTTTAIFPVNLFRITDVFTTPLLGGASDVVTLTYQLTQTMNFAWNIYHPGTQIVASSATWPPCGSITPAAGCLQIVKDGQATAPVITFKGLRVGRQRYTEFWDGRDANGLFVPDGNYVFTLTAESTSPVTSTGGGKVFPTDRIFGSVSVARGAIVFTSFAVKPEIPVLFNSSNTIQLHPFTVEYGLNRQSSVTIQILTATLPSTVVRTVVAGAVRDAGVLLQDTWDGRDDRGNFPRPGFYNVRASAEDLASVLSSGSTSQLTITYEPLRIYDVAVSPIRQDTPSAGISFQISEPMRISLKIFRPGTIFDSAGNPSPPESLSLVKRIVEAQPARTLLEKSWDGTDLRQALVPDGTYRFKLVASTDSAAIDPLTGNILNASALAVDRIIDDIPVARNGAVDVYGAFVTNTFVYPNPLKNPTARFNIYAPIQGKVLLKLYNISGELVLDKDFGEKTFDTHVAFDWAKVNQSGRPVGRGLYYAVIRIEETIGGRNVLQVVKKLLIP